MPILLDRSLEPPVFDVKVPAMPGVQIFPLSEHDNLYVLPGGAQPLILLRFFMTLRPVLPADALVFNLLDSTIPEGTHSRSAHQIAQDFSLYGSGLNLRHDPDHIELSVYVLPRNLEPLCEAVLDVLTNACFPAENVEYQLSSEASMYENAMLYSKYPASANQIRSLFGSQHPYGFTTLPADILSVKPQQLQSVYNKYIASAPIQILAAGELNTKDIAIISKVFGARAIQNTVSELVPAPQSRATGVQMVDDCPDSVQASMRMGRFCPSQRDADYPVFRMMNLIFGGYFGSRLMKSIREEKGYTYGISSSVSNTGRFCRWGITAEIKKEAASHIATDIYEIMEQMGSHPPDQAELDQARNYLKGQLLSIPEHPIKYADYYASMILGRYGSHYWQHSIDSLDKISVDQVAQAAKSFLLPDLMITTIAGG